MESGSRIRRKHGSPTTQDPAATRAARINSGMKQQDVAAALGISQSLLCEIESGSRSAQPVVLLGLAALYEVEPADLERKPCDSNCGCTCHLRESA